LRRRETLDGRTGRRGGAATRRLCSAYAASAEPFADEEPPPPLPPPEGPDGLELLDPSDEPELLPLPLPLEEEPELPPEEPESLDFDEPPLLEDELYRSAYQPPPLSMKPVPPEICRFAVCSWQRGHSVSGASLMDCSVSHSLWQAVQAYS